MNDFVAVAENYGAKVTPQLIMLNIGGSVKWGPIILAFTSIFAQTHQTTPVMSW